MRTLLVALATLACCSSAHAAMVTQDLAFTASDGAHLHAVLGAEGAIAPRPTIIEFSPYAPGCCASIAGPAYNYVQVHARGTGDSDGRWSATGPRDQADIAEFLGWACNQPWSNGALAIYGFSASAIVAYNAMDLELPCLRTAVLMAGSADLYRDLLYVGGIPNFAPGAVVLGGIGALTLSQGFQRMQRNPASGVDAAAGQFGLGVDYLSHPTEDAYWQDRTLDPSALHVPILADTGFYDVESRGPFEAYKLTKHLGTQLMVMGAHDRVPAGTSQFPRFKRWFDHYLLGEDNGIESEPHVQAWLSNGSHEELLAGKFTKLEGDDWPLPGTRWTPLYLDGKALSAAPATAETAVSYPFAPSNPIASDTNTTTTVGPTGGGGFTFESALSLFPGITEMNQADTTSATFTTPTLREAIDAVGPASLHLRLASTAPESDIHAVITDVWPDGSAHPVALGRLRTSYPDTVAARNVVDPVSGELVQPYGDFSAKTLAEPTVARDYDVEFWPIGNHFAAGHSIRLYVTGTALYATPTAPGVNTITTGGPAHARLVLPTVGAEPSF